MALAETTISTAVAATDNSIVVASATSIAVDRVLRIDDEYMRVTKSYTAGSTTVPVLRGREGSAITAHVVSARVVHGTGDDFLAARGQFVTTPHVRGRRTVSITADNSTCPLPLPGEDLIVVLNGTSVINMTVPVPTKDLDGCELTIVAQTTGAHVITFTGGLSDAGSSYDIVTFNGTKKTGMKVLAIDETWVSLIAVPMAGTVTNLTGTVA